LTKARQANRILAIKNGEIVKVIIHRKLIEKTAHYAQFYARQFSQQNYNYGSAFKNKSVKILAIAALPIRSNPFDQHWAKYFLSNVR
jgi:hypothetical protein